MSITLRLENGDEEELFVNGVQMFIRRRDIGPTENIEVEAGVSGYAAGRRGDFAFLSFWPSNANGS